METIEKLLVQARAYIECLCHFQKDKLIKMLNVFLSLSLDSISKLLQVKGCILEFVVNKMIFTS